MIFLFLLFVWRKLFTFQIQKLFICCFWIGFPHKKLWDYEWIEIGVLLFNKILNFKVFHLKSITPKKYSNIVKNSKCPNSRQFKLNFKKTPENCLRSRTSSTSDTCSSNKIKQKNEENTTCLFSICLNIKKDWKLRFVALTYHLKYKAKNNNKKPANLLLYLRNCISYYLRSFFLFARSFYH